MSKVLSPELVALVHHIELNKAGWWDRSLQRLIAGTLWLELTPPDEAELLRDLSVKHAIEVDEARFSENLQRLVELGDVVRLSDGRLKLSESHAATIKRDVDASLVDAKRAQQEFADALVANGCNLDAAQTWEKFKTEFIIPFVRISGARAYEVIVGQRPNTDLSGLQDFVCLFVEEEREPLRLAVRRFFDCGVPAVRRHILEYVFAGFAVASSSLDQASLKAVSSSMRKPPRLRLFLDTNFLFSVLGIHDEVEVRCASALRTIIDKIDDHLPVSLYVVDATLDELTRAISLRVRSLKQLRLGPNLARVAGDLLGGTARRFAEACADAGYALDADQYFSPYLTNLLGLLKGRGVELFNQPTARYRTRQDVVDDVHEREEYEKKRWKADAKIYDLIEHDIVLWHFAKDHRAPRSDSPLDAEYFIVTEDTRFLGFDAFKTRDIPMARLCLHPSVLLQLLQFWVPRTPEFEDALFGSLGLGAMFRPDAESEQVTVQILRTLSRFENVGDLSDSEVRTILVNDALRSRVERTGDQEEQVRLVREQLIALNDEKKRQLASAATAQDSLAKSFQAERAARLATESQLASEQEGHRATRIVANEERQRADQLEQRVGYLEDHVNGQKAREDERRERWRFAKTMSAKTATLALAGVGVGFLLHKFGGFSPALSVVAGSLTWFVTVFVVFDHTGSRVPAIAKWSVFATLTKWRAWIVTFLVGSLLSTLFVDWVKAAYARLVTLLN